MDLFDLFSLAVIIAIMYLAVNLMRYFFFKESDGGHVFGLSDKWLKRDENLMNSKKKGKKNE
jgi:hypothetical protein